MKINYKLMTHIFSSVVFSIALLLTPAIGNAWTLMLTQDLGVKGTTRLCKYNDNKIYTISASQLCPMTFEGSAPGMGVGVGHLAGEREDGIHKICIYEVLSERKATRVGAAELCPLTQEFR